MKTYYTPAPWDLKSTGDGKAILINRGYVGEVHSDDIGHNESQANAKLISSAPEMFEAIQYYFDVLREVNGESWDQKPDHVLSKFISAYNKANFTDAIDENDNEINF